MYRSILILKMKFTLLIYILVIASAVFSQSNEDDTSQNFDIGNCTIAKDHHIYDLSSLSQRDFWKYTEASPILDDEKNVQYRTFYLSICHPIVGKSNCGNNSQVCFSDPNQNSSIFINAGVNLKTSILHEGLIEVNFNNGQVCQKGTKKDSHYSTSLYLQCPSTSSNASDGDSESPGPILLTSKNPCSFMFIWTTLAACPKKIVSDKGCIVTLSNSEYPINLHALSGPKYHTASGFNRSFEINICQSIIDGSCTGKDVLVCDTTNKEDPKVIASVNDFSYNASLNNGILYYSQNVEMKLQCDRTEFDPIVRYFPQADKEGVKHIFTVTSVFMCTPKESDCVFEDAKLHTYDLRPLHRKKNNWEVIVREEGKQKLFHLNVCGPIHHNKYAQCPEGPIGVCQTSVTARSARNHGFITSQPVVKSDGSIILLYTGGESCREGVPTSSSRVNLICSESDYNPIFVEVTNSCEYVFLWHTRSACPQNVVQGKGCRVTDPVYGNVYDLNPLRNAKSDYKVKIEEFEFNLNICGKLLSECGKDELKSAGICHLGSEKNISGGSYPSQLVFNDGTIFMKFINGSAGCGNLHWESQILLLCSHTDVGDHGPQYLHADFDACTHYFIWYTKYACPPHTEINCVANDENQNVFYDLTPLSSPKFNQIFIIKNNTKKFVLNVCRSVVHSKESRCSYDAGACLIDKSHKESALSLGKVKSSPEIKDGTLMLRYTDGDLCNGSQNYETLIEFKCTKNEYLSYPNFIGEEDCLYLFEWATIHACPQVISSDNSPKSKEIIGNCTVRNPNTDHLFDMNILARSMPYEIPLSDDSLMLINICTYIKDERCKHSGVGACIVGRQPWQKYSMSAGNLTKNLQFNMWNTFLEYSGGDKCQNGYERSTKISFVCQQDSPLDGPFLIDFDQENCVTFINWYTEEACERHISCLAKSWDRVIDLTPLMNTGSNYEVTDPNDRFSKYFINVCKPLNPIIGINCYPGSSACMINGSSANSSHSPLSLGLPLITPVITGGDNVSLMYVEGAPCPGHADALLSSKIFFKCHKSIGPGSPKFLQKTHDCQFQFEWETSLVCKEDLSKDSGDQCQIYFEAAKANLELRPLYHPDGYMVDFNNKTFLINVCGSVCSHSGICTNDTGENFGLSQKSELKWQQGFLVLQYYSGDPCVGSQTGYKIGKIFFECDMKAGYGLPTPDPIMNDSECMAIFNWRTNATCLEAIYKPNVPSYSSPAAPHIDENATTISPSTAANDSMPDPSPAPNNNGQSIAIGIIIFVIVLVLVIFYLAKDGYIQRAYQRVRFFSKKGDQIVILDDRYE